MFYKKKKIVNLIMTVLTMPYRPYIIWLMGSLYYLQISSLLPALQPQLISVLILP